MDGFWNALVGVWFLSVAISLWLSGQLLEGVLHVGLAAVVWAVTLALFIGRKSAVMSKESAFADEILRDLYLSPDAGERAYRALMNKDPEIADPSLNQKEKAKIARDFREQARIEMIRRVGEGLQNTAIDGDSDQFDDMARVGAKLMGIGTLIHAETGIIFTAAIVTGAYLRRKYLK